MRHPLVILALLALVSGSAAAEEPALPLRAIADIPLAGKPTRLDYQSLDPRTHLLFVAHLGDGVVHVVDTEKRRVVADIPDVAQVHGVLAVPELGRAYATATGSKEVVAIDEKTLKVTARIPVEGYPDGLAYDPASMKLYVSDEESGQEAVIDMRENRRLGFVSVGGEAGNTQFDPGSRRILVNVQTTGEIVAIDPATDKVVERTKLEGADGNHGLFIDAERRLAYIACEGSSRGSANGSEGTGLPPERSGGGSSRLVVFDLGTRKVTATFALGKGPDVLAFDPGLRRLYVSSESGVISIFEARERALTKIGEGLLVAHAHTVAVDPATHRVYFPLKEVGGKPVLRVMEAVVPAGDAKG